MKTEHDTELIIDEELTKLGWNLNPISEERNVYKKIPKYDYEKEKLGNKKPDYMLYINDELFAIIEAKKIIEIFKSKKIKPMNIQIYMKLIFILFLMVLQHLACIKNLVILFWSKIILKLIIFLLLIFYTNIKIILI